MALKRNIGGSDRVKYSVVLQSSRPEEEILIIPARWDGTYNRPAEYQAGSGWCILSRHEQEELRYSSVRNAPGSYEDVTLEIWLSRTGELRMSMVERRRDYGGGTMLTHFHPAQIRFAELKTFSSLQYFDQPVRWKTKTFRQGSTTVEQGQQVTSGWGAEGPPPPLSGMERILYYAEENSGEKLRSDYGAWKGTEIPGKPYFDPLAPEESQQLTDNPDNEPLLANNRDREPLPKRRDIHPRIGVSHPRIEASTSENIFVVEPPLPLEEYRRVGWFRRLFGEY
ncbi:hypothetical protein [Glutamicibacter ardleyensis]|uniref:hypothetical protein n=1 Tax=Glutamicibacter ardleyensis TaxID=225894 RepID=UPI003FCF1700